MFGFAGGFICARAADSKKQHNATSVIENEMCLLMSRIVNSNEVPVKSERLLSYRSIDGSLNVSLYHSGMESGGHCPFSLLYELPIVLQPLDGHVRDFVWDFGPSYV